MSGSLAYHWPDEEGGQTENGRASVLLTKEEGHDTSPCQCLRKPGRKSAEYKMQGAIACWLYVALPPESGAWWSSIDLGMTSSRAAFFRKWRGCKSGTPDMLFIRRRRPYWVELKSPETKGRPSKAQRRVFAALAAAGCRWAVCRSGGEVETVLRRWRFPLSCRYSEHFPIPDEVKSKPWRRGHKDRQETPGTAVKRHETPILSP
ncbi:MAG: VRR-NUC domain-containing protein [Acetobacteraceae bacterium]